MCVYIFWWWWCWYSAVSLTFFANAAIPKCECQMSCVYMYIIFKFSLLLLFRFVLFFYELLVAVIRTSQWSCKQKNSLYQFGPTKRKMKSKCSKIKCWCSFFRLLMLFVGKKTAKKKEWLEMNALIFRYLTLHRSNKTTTTTFSSYERRSKKRFYNQLIGSLWKYTLNRMQHNVEIKTLWLNFTTNRNRRRWK